LHSSSQPKREAYSTANKPGPSVEFPTVERLFGLQDLTAKPINRRGLFPSISLSLPLKTVSMRNNY
jgi:hypothetical protein